MAVECPRCKASIEEGVLTEGCGVCSECGYHFKLSTVERINCFCSDWREVEVDLSVLKSDPLNFHDKFSYSERLNRAREKSGLESALTVGMCRLSENLEVAMGVFDFDFLGGTMGIVVGEKIRALFDTAAEKGLPVVIFFSSGGARMQEGLFALMQMPKVTVVAEEFKATGLPFVSVLTHPTTGGVLASIAYRGDVVIAEPGADVGFTGKRIIRTLTGLEIPGEFQKAERVRELGYLDDVVDRREMRNYLVKLLEYLLDR